MAAKKLTLLLYSADRQLWKGRPTTLTVTDVSRSDLRILKRAQFGPRAAVVELQLHLLFDAGQVYGIVVAADGHRPAWQLVRRRTFIRQEGREEFEVSEAIVRLMLVPRRPRSLDLEQGYPRLAELGSRFVGNRGLTEEQYENLETPNKMAFLNLEAKLRATRVESRSLLSYVLGVRAVEPDRVYLFMEPELKPLVHRSPDFASAPVHRRPGQPQELPAHPDSWKHLRFPAGNVQLSFSRTTEAVHEDDTVQGHSVDVDIDLARGLGHVLEWMDNNMIRPGKKTDQTLVYALLYTQGILPVYTLAASWD